MFMRVVIGLSILLQLTAVVLSIRLIRISRHRAAWLMIAAGLALMAVRQSVLLTRTASDLLDPFAEGMCLLLSGCFAAGLAGVGPFFASLSRSEEKLRESEEGFRMMVEGAKDYAFVMLNTEGRVADWNAGARRMFGFEAGDVLDKSHACLLVADGQPGGRSKEVVRSASETGRYENEGWGARKDGSRFWANVELTALRDGAGNLRGFAMITRDMTERQRLEQQFRQAQKMEAMGRLAGGVAHDFNNLLTVITGYSQILLNRLPPDHPERPQVEEVLKAGDRAAGLTRQLLAFSRKQVIQPKVLDLNAVVNDVGRMLRRLIGEDVDLVTSLYPSLGRVLADPGQLEQVLMNLAVNARDAMPQGGRLLIETANADLNGAFVQQHPFVKPGPYVLLSVQDTGCGMNAETLSHVFEPFFTTKEAGKGTGLGLATVYGIVKQSNGYIFVDSEPGRGAVFRIYLPRVWGKAATGEAHPPKAAAGRGTETILLVEDEPAVRAFARGVLLERGYVVLDAGSGDEALALFARQGGAIHLLLTDSVMPQMSGGDLARRLAALQPAVKVLYMSGHTESDVARHGGLKEHAAVLYKPFTPDVLARRVREILDGDGGSSSDSPSASARPLPRTA